MTRLAGNTSRGAPPARREPATVPQKPQPAAGPVIGPWQLTRLIHRGERVVLFRARPAETVAGPGCYVVKAANPESRGLPVARAMLRREAHVLADVSHPNLSALLAASTECDQPHLVLPYLEGATLRQVSGKAARSFPVPIATSLWIARQVAEALAALHSAGWLHGQVRPEHVLVSPQGQATLIDLGLARRLGTAECEIASPVGEESGCLAPEALAKGGRLEAASDIYGLGLLLFELIAERPALADRNPARLRDLHRREAPPDLRAWRADAAPEVAHLVRQMLAKDPLRRPAADELASQLAELEIAALEL